MLKQFVVIVTLAGLTTGAMAQQTPRPPDRVVLVHTDDPEMNAAQAKARDSLGEFWKHFILPGGNESGFALKIAISDGRMIEHFWCNEIVGGSSGATCRIDNEPKDVHVVKMGERIPVEPALISDWMYLRDGKIQGGESIRVLLPKMTPEEAAVYREMLEDPVDEPAETPAG
jgi:uncharacterized protein YegJ (DUF2314 family)